jgi:type IV pilus modification protein PilV
MKPFTFKSQIGIGLIEVLITAIVIAIGLLAVGSLQTGFMASSSDSKTRSEALTLAERKMEELRNNITVNGYNALTATTTSDSITGTSTTFARGWTITGGDAPNLKNISVIVSWNSDDGADSDGDGNIIDMTEKVNIVSQIAFLDPTKSAMYADEQGSGGSMTVPSPRQNASEDVAVENVDATTQTPLPPTVTATLVNGELPPAITVTGDEGTTFVLTPITTELPATHYYATAFGNGIIGVYLCTDDGLCTYIQNHFGGVPLRIAGTVYSTSGNTLDHIRVAWSSSEVRSCYNGTKVRNPSSGNLIYHSMPYECVFAGNCNATSDGVNNCYPDSDVTDTQINARRVGPGGEYGELGLLGVDDQGGNREQVCFLEDTTDPATSPLLNASGSDVQNENYLFAVSKRSYATRRIKRGGSINEQTSEGINRSYTNHNFLIIARGSGATANQLCNSKAVANNLQIAPREVIRILNENGEPNQVLPGTSYNGAAGTAKVLTGSVTSSATNLRLYIPETGVCFLNNNLTPSTAATLYACAVASDAPTSSASSGVQIIGGSEEHPNLSPSVFAICTKKDSTTCNWLTNFSATTSTPTTCTAPWGDQVATGDSVTAYQDTIVPFGSECVSQTGTCQSDGTFSPNITYTNQNCAPASTEDCTTPWNTTVTNGQSVSAYKLATVPADTSCDNASNVETRLCADGILSGSYTNASCAEQTTRTISVNVTQTGTGSVSDISVTGSGAICTGTSCSVANDWTGTLSASGTCSGTSSTVSGTSGTLSSTATTASITLANCTGPVCPKPWDSTQTIASGESLIAYGEETVPYNSDCSSVQHTRFCNDGSLSGEGVYETCSVASPLSCIFGVNTYNHGSSIPGYSSTTVTSPANCGSVAQTGTCNNGSISWPSPASASCSVVYNITATPANGSGNITSTTCNGGACSGLAPGSYTFAAALSGGSSCSKTYSISSSNIAVTVTKATGQSTSCTMTP